MAPIVEYPADCGRRLLPNLIDHIALTDPTRLFVSLPKSPDILDGFHDVGYQTYATAINRYSWRLDQEAGRPRHDFEKIAYMGPSDFRYAIFVIAAVKAGYVVLTPEKRMPMVDNLLSERSLKHLTMPQMDWFLQEVGNDVKAYPYSKTFEEAKLDPFVALQSSGSTGPPKLIVNGHGTFAAQDAFQTIPSLGGQPVNVHYLRGRKMFCPFPLFHGAALGTVLATNIYAEMTVVLPPTVPLTTELSDIFHTHGAVNGTCLPPSVLVDIVHNPEYLKHLQDLDFVCYGGGPLPKEVGDRIAISGKPLLNFFGSSETNLLPTEVLDPEDWEYFKFSPFLGHDFRAVGDGLSELFIVRNQALEPFQGVFSTFPSLQEYGMKDTYEPHPVKPDLWRFTGRSDDVVVFSNGETFNPLVMEGMITSHPAVKSALVAGHGKFQAALLVEPNSTEPVSAGALIDEIWPTVQKANQQCASQGSIAKELILVTAFGKPMLRASKGTVQRKATLQLYSTELEVLYTADASLDFDERLSQLDLGDHKQAVEALVTLISRQLNVDQLDEQQNLFQIGLDSLQALSLTKQINRLLRTSGRSITTATIFANATVVKLAEALATPSLQNGNSSGHLSDPMQRYKELDTLLERYTPHFTTPATRSYHLADQRSSTRVVILTGSTGSLGSYLLDTLTQNPSIGRVYCLNRNPKSSQRQHHSQVLKGLPTDFQKVTFLQWNPTIPQFGLDRSDYETLLMDVTDIVHNAWEVNFNLPIESFEPHLSGVQQFIEFSFKSANRAHIFFISTLGTVSNYHAFDQQTLVPEKPMEQWSNAEDAGYPQSKLVAERILLNASRTHEVHATICRVGQIAGPTGRQGIWQEQEWLPSLVASAKYLRMIPQSLGPMDVVDWIPVNLVAKIVEELSASERESTADEGTNGAGHREREEDGGLSVVHVVNPKKTTWQNLLPIIQKQIPDVQVTEYSTWVAALGQSLSDGPKDVHDNPAVKLLAFFEGIEMGMTEAKGGVTLDTRCSEAKSQTMRGLQQVGSEWMVNWMRQWEGRN
ncbi:MAG: hypothetical protein Q9182_000935 [Xanthomendoza sp. 2 TL-2023]